MLHVNMDIKQTSYEHLQSILEARNSEHHEYKLSALILSYVTDSPHCMKVSRSKRITIKHPHGSSRYKKQRDYLICMV
jgi:hypothetical protein